MSQKRPESPRIEIYDMVIINNMETGLTCKENPIENHDLKQEEW
jgi:hypothetical protein